MSRVKFSLTLPGLMITQASMASDVATTPAVQSTVSTAGNLFSVLFGLAAVIAMIVGLAWMARRFGMLRPQNNTLIQVVGSASLGTRERVAIVQIQDSWIVVGVSPSGVNSLATLPRGNASLPPEFVSPTGFSERLKTMLEARSKNA